MTREGLRGFWGVLADIGADPVDYDAGGDDDDENDADDGDDEVRVVPVMTEVLPLPVKPTGRRKPLTAFHSNSTTNDACYDYYNHGYNYGCCDHFYSDRNCQLLCHYAPNPFPGDVLYPKSQKFKRSTANRPEKPQSPQPQYLNREAYAPKA